MEEQMTKALDDKIAESQSHMQQQVNSIEDRILSEKQISLESLQ